MRVIFLDIDGVLNSEQEVIWQARRRGKHGDHIRGTHSIYRFLDKLFPQYQLVHHWLYYCTSHCRFCPIACSNLQYILDECPDARIVVSSTWRSWGIPWLKRILGKNGIDTSKIIDVTGYERGIRGVQIKAWLNRNPEVKQFAILDDDSDMGELMDSFVKIDNQIGLTIRNARQAIKLMGGASKPKPVTSNVLEDWYEP